MDNTRHPVDTDFTANLLSTITCPECGHRETETMPIDNCQLYYECKGCGVVLRPKQGDCCVYCSFGTAPCPSIQEARQKDNGSAACCDSE